MFPILASPVIVVLHTSYYTYYKLATFPLCLTADDIELQQKGEILIYLIWKEIIKTYIFI